MLAGRLLTDDVTIMKYDDENPHWQVRPQKKFRHATLLKILLLVVVIAIILFVASLSN